MPSSIPILNAYYLFLYAWDLFPEGGSVDVQSTEETDLPNLFARILESGIRRLLRRGLDRGYREVVEETQAPRGRFLISETIKRASQIQGRAVCIYDELSADIPRNQILKATARLLCKSDGIDNEIAHKLRLLLRRFDDVSDRPASRSLFRYAQLTRNSRHYDLLLHICRLIQDYLLPGEGQGRARFADILQDEVRMSSVFESFVRNFYRTEQRSFNVNATIVPWNINATSFADMLCIPEMRTDVVLRSPERAIIIDAKFYKEVLVTNRWGGRKIRSEHLYQILSYMRHSVEQDPIETEGVLLYAATKDEHLDLEYEVSGQRLKIRTLQLDRPWHEIHADLLRLPAPASAGTTKLLGENAVVEPQGLSAVGH